MQMVLFKLIIRYLTSKRGKPFYLVETYNITFLLKLIQFKNDLLIKLGR